MAVAETVDRRRIRELTERELARFTEERPRSREFLSRGRSSMPRGVPMSWMTQLFGHPPIYVDGGEGAYFTDVDGHRYLDTNLADTSMFCGYSPEPVIRAVAERMAKGPQFLMPTEDAVWVSEELSRRFGLPRWQYTLSATLANTEAIRVARHATGRPKLLMFTGKYHGHGDEMLVTLENGEVAPEYYGLPPNVAANTVLIEFNDLEALAKALAGGDVACVLTEPALTNVGVIEPEPGFHEAVRRITRETGTLLILDEVHTIICGPSGLTGRWGLEPDIVTLGKSIGGGVPIGAYGMTEEVAVVLEAEVGDYGGGDFVPEVATGGTLFANALSMAAARAALGDVLTDEAFDRTAALGARLADGIQAVARGAGLPWRAHRLFARSGYSFDGALARNAAEAHQAHDSALYRLLRAHMANRGVWEAIEWAGPAVSVPATEADVDFYLSVLADLAADLTP